MHDRSALNEARPLLQAERKRRRSAQSSKRASRVQRRKLVTNLTTEETPPVFQSNHQVLSGSQRSKGKSAKGNTKARPLLPEERKRRQEEIVKRAAQRLHTATLRKYKEETAPLFQSRRV